MSGDGGMRKIFDYSGSGDDISPDPELFIQYTNSLEPERSELYNDDFGRKTTFINKLPNIYKKGNIPLILFYNLFQIFHQ